MTRTTAPADLSQQVAGPVLRPADEGYAAELAGFDLSVGQRPGVVVGATGAADVVAGVRHAREVGLPVAVQATGHGITVPADDALLITTRRAGAVRVDPFARTAWLEAGAVWARVLQEAAPFGLAPLAGSAPAVGAVSYTLGGGLGVLGRRWGFSADHVRRLDLVTADGVLRRVTADEHPDLFWALRGGGGNSGVVTGMEIELVELAELYGGGLFFPGEDAAAVLTALLAVGRDAPRRGQPVGRGHGLPRPPGGVRAAAWTVVLPRPRQLVGPAGAVRGRHRAPAPGRDADRGHGAHDAGHRGRHDPRRSRDAARDQQPLPRAAHPRRRHGGDRAGPREPAHALRHRDAPARRRAGPGARRARRRRAPARRRHGLPHPAGPTTSDTAAEQALLDDLAPWSDGGALVNFLAGPHVSAADVRAAYEPDRWARLVEVKTAWDPDNVFRINHDVPPAGSR